MLADLIFSSRSAAFDSNRKTSTTIHFNSKIPLNGGADHGYRSKEAIKAAALTSASTCQRRGGQKHVAAVYENVYSRGSFPNDCSVEDLEDYLSYRRYSANECSLDAVRKVGGTTATVTFDSPPYDKRLAESIHNLNQNFPEITIYDTPPNRIANMTPDVPDPRVRSPPKFGLVDTDDPAECIRNILKAARDMNLETVANTLASHDEEFFKNNINDTDSTGRTLLSYLASSGSVDLIEELFKVLDLDYNKPDNEGNTPLHFASQAGHSEIVCLLLNSCLQLEIDARNCLGFTPLMKAALQGRTKCAKFLLYAGASPTMRDTGRGLRAEQWARFCGRYNCADAIEKLARNRLLERTTSYGRWGSDPELGPHLLINGRLMQPPSSLQRSGSQRHSIKSKLKRAFRTSSNPDSTANQYSLVTQLTGAALCASSPALPVNTRTKPMVKSLLRPLTVPKVTITGLQDQPNAPVTPQSPETRCKKKHKDKRR
ncbi:uncharacterized protein LOC126906018 isoform X2 [Daktulosphaira vitifoliae]|uniref:uncharacterized protein LOC126906018 isoform X2 n=1 Tax=Daktulosphaira vitifoliae TaxID=58002 RepID=UPI0021AA8E8D|nr:uncharacterized protein LOC126906018 isoform X2 [Daktulosphaira vitifoliae]